MISKHAATLGSGSHFPFPIHVDALGPVIAGSLNPIIVIDSSTNNAGF